MLKYAIGLLVLLVISLGFTAKGLIDTKEELVLKAQDLKDMQKRQESMTDHYEQQLSDLQQAVARRDARINLLARQADEAKERYDEVESKHPDWADTRTPDDVADRLCEYVNCTGPRVQGSPHP